MSMAIKKREGANLSSVVKQTVTDLYTQYTAFT